MINKPNLDPEANSKRYYALLATALALTIFAPVLEHHMFGHYVIGALSGTALIVATLASGAGKLLARMTVSLAVVVTVVWICTLFVGSTPFFSMNIQGFAYILTLLFVALVAFVMMKDIFTNEVNGNRVAGAICVYILVGFSFAIIHMLTLNHDPNAYKDSSIDELTNQSRKISGRRIYPLFVYFSFCTLSTVGYGDIVPVSRLARTVSWLEAIIGQIYLTVLVARLVGLHIAASSNSGSNSSNSSNSSSNSSNSNSNSNSNSDSNSNSNSDSDSDSNNSSDSNSNSNSNNSATPNINNGAGNSPHALAQNDPAVMLELSFKQKQSE